MTLCAFLFNVLFCDFSIFILKFVSFATRIGLLYAVCSRYYELGKMYDWGGFQTNYSKMMSFPFM